MEKSATLPILESCGLTFSRIPAGDYSVGLDDHSVQLLANPPQISWDGRPRTTPPRQVTVEAFFISTDLLRLEPWLALLAHPRLPGLADLISIDHLIEIEGRKTTETTVTVEPPAGEVQRAGSQAQPKQLPQQPVF